MKRLKRKASEQITLYHGTSSQVLLNIISDGKIIPGGAGQISNGLTGRVAPSGNQNGIYLTESSSEAGFYCRGAIDNAVFDPSMPNIGVILEILVNTDNLVADLDDWSGDKNIDWKTSLDRIGQVVHNGAIDVSSIASVTFSTRFNVGNILSSSNPQDAKSFVRNALTIKTPMSVSEAQNEINNLYEQIKTEEN